MIKPQISAEQKEELKSIAMERAQLQKDLKTHTERVKQVLAQLDKKVSNILYVNGLDSYEFYADRGLLFSLSPSVIKIKKVVQKKIKWKMEEIEKNLSQKKIDSFVDKKYMIKDIEKLTSLVRAAGISAKDFKSCISVEKTVNADRLDSAIELGEIERKELIGCYELEEGSKFLRYTVSDKSENAKS